MNESELLRSAHFVIEPDGLRVSISDVLITQGLPALIIGSADRAHLRLTGDDVAPGHAALRLLSGRYVLQYLPGAKLSPGLSQPRPLSDGDRIHIGGHTLRFVLGEPVAALAPVKPAAVAAAAPAPVAAAPVPVEVAPAAFSAPAATTIHRPASAPAVDGGRRTAGIVLGVGVLMALLVGGLAWLWPTLFPPGPAPIEFAYNDGNVSLVMFDADW